MSVMVKDAAVCLHQAMKGLNVNERVDKISTLSPVAWASNIRNEYLSSEKQNVHVFSLFEAFNIRHGSRHVGTFNRRGRYNP